MNNSLQISLPDEWEIKSLNEVLDQMTDYVANGSFKSLRENVTVFEDPNFAYYIRLFDLRLGIGHSKQNYVDEVSYNFLKKSYLKGGEILIANIGANVGEIFMMPSIDRPATIAPNMILCRPNKKMNSKYLFYFLSSSLGKSLISREISGSGQPKLNKTGLKTVPVYTPQLREQQKIASILSSVDEAIEKTNKIIKQIKIIKKGLIKNLIAYGIGEEKFKSSELGELPEHWEVVVLGDILEVSYGKNQKNVEIEEGDIPILGTGGLIGYASEPLYSKPSVLIGRKGTIDKPQFIDKPFWTIDTLFYTKINEKVAYPMFLYYVFTTINWKKYNEATGVPSLSAKNISQINIKLPPLQEQKEMASIIESISLKEGIEKDKLKGLIQLKNGLMQQLLTGKIRVPLNENEEVPQ